MASGPRVIDRIAALIAHIFYRIDIVGTVPLRGSLLLLPNHPNALLDPALVMASAGRPVRFLAKSTLFDGPFRPLLAAADAIPVYRRQDGAETTRNDQTFAAVAESLARGEAVCVFPEGISHSSGRLETLRTGAARMTLAAVRAGVDVRLVPVGINLERKTTFRSRATVAFGLPFRPDEGAGSGDAVKQLTEQIAAHMRALLIEADPDRDAELVLRVNGLYRAGRAVEDSPEADLARRKVIANALLRLRAERPDFYDSALVQLRRYDDRLRRFNLSDDTLDWDLSRTAALRFIAKEGPLALLLIPVGAASAFGFAVPYALTSLASKLTRDTDVTATAKVIAGAVIYTAWVTLLGAAAWWFGGPLGAMSTMVGLSALAIAGLFAIERESAAWQTARSWLALRGTRRTTRAALQRRRAELADVLDEVNDWILSTRPDEAARADHVR